MTQGQSGRGRVVNVAVALLLAAFITGLLAGGYLLASSALADLEAGLRSRLETISRLRAAAGQSRWLLASTPGEGSAGLQADFFAGVQDPIIVAELQNRLRAIAIDRSVELNSANTLPVREIGTVNYLGLRIVVRGQLKNIQSVLHAVETGSPLLFVDRIAMRVDSWPIKSSDPSQDGAAAIIAELDIFGAKLPAVVTAAPVPAPTANGGLIAVPNPQDDLISPAPKVLNRGGRRS